MRQYIFIIELIVIIYSTSFGQPNSNYKMKGTANLKLIDEFQIPSNTIFGCEYASVGKQKSLLILTLEGIQFLDISDGVIYKRIKYPDMQVRFNSIRVINANSFLIGSGMPYDYYLLDFNGKVLKKYSLNPNNNQFPFKPAPYLDFSYSNLIGDIFYISGSIITTKPIEENICPLISLNIKTGEKKYLLKYPSEYNLNRGGMQNNYHYLCTNTEGKIIISFPASNDLLIYNPLSKKTIRKHAGSCRIPRLIASDLKEMDVVKAKEQYNKYFFTTPSYEQVLYDIYRDLYLRVALHPNTNYGKGNSFYKPKSLILLDKNYKFIGEEELDINVINVFTYPDGLITVGFDKQNKTNIMKKYEIIL